MDPFDSLYQQMDSKALLDAHRRSLVAEARDVLASSPTARVAAMIATPDSREAAELRRAHAQTTGGEAPNGLMVGLVPREALAGLLARHVDPELWREEAWQPQRVLPAMVATRDGYRFALFPLDEIPLGEPHGTADTDS